MLMRSLVELLVPVRCFGCGRGDGPACRDCLTGRVTTRTPSCVRCNGLSLDGRTCRRCRHATALSGVTAASRYDGLPRDLVLALKSRNDRQLARVLADLMVPALPPRYLDCVTCVPTAPSRYRERGHNPSEMLAREVARGLGLPYRALALRRGNVHQVGQGRRERFRQVEGAFLALPGAARAGRVLVVDDVLTTGATMGELARTLKEAGAISVWGAAAARD